MNSNTLWQSQAVESPRISLQYVRHQAERLNTDIRRELRLGYASSLFGAIVLAALLLAPTSAWMAAQVPDPIVLLVQLTAFLVVVGCVYLTVQIRHRSRLQLTVQKEQVLQSLQSYRTALERRRDHYLGAWRWSFWPLVPGVAVILGGSLLFDPRPHKLLRLGVAAAVCAGSFWLGTVVAKRKGARLQTELDALNTLDENPPASNSGA